jgi:uncharacterized protein (DUF1697 family)
MKVIICLLRGVNLGPHHKIKMDELRALYISLGLRDVQTYVQSGNVVFRTDDRNLIPLARRLEAAIEKKFGFHSDIILRTTADLRAVVNRNPFAKRRQIDNSKLLATFLADHPPKELCAQILAVKPDGEELHLDGRELYVYFPNGIGRSKLFSTLFGKLIKKEGTGRNWNTVLKLLEMAEALEAQSG